MKTEFRSTTVSEDKLIKSAVYELFREKLQRFISAATFGLIATVILALISAKATEYSFSERHYIYIHLCVWTYLFVVSLGYQMYYRKMNRMLDGGYQVLDALMVKKVISGSKNSRKMTIGVTVDSGEFDENAIMPVVKKENITTRVGYKQLKAYESGEQALLVKYNASEGFWDECDCIPLKF